MTDDKDEKLADHAFEALTRFRKGLDEFDHAALQAQEVPEGLYQYLEQAARYGNGVLEGGHRGGLRPDVLQAAAGLFGAIGRVAKNLRGVR